MGRKTAIGGLLLFFVTVVGCQHEMFMTETDYNDAHGHSLPNLECDAQASLTIPPAATPPPTTVDDTTRNIRYMSLHEAIAIALERGTVGGQSGTSPGFANDNLVGFTGNGVSTDDSIRVLSLDPAITATNIEGALAKFDAHFNTSVNWTHTSNPFTSPFQALQVGLPVTGAIPPGAINTSTVAYSSYLAKPLPTGGVAGITFNTNYTVTNHTSGLNPLYQPSLQFGFEQPLLEGFGTEINQLRASNPGSLLFPGLPTGGRVEGILITRIRLDQQRANYEHNINFLLLNVETAYWNLYGAYYQLYSREEAMRQSLVVWHQNKLQYDAGRISIIELSVAETAYQQFRTQRLTAVGQVLESERQLRGLLGLKIEDGTRIVPADAPTLAPFAPDWITSLNQALSQRPELALARQDLKAQQFNVINIKNLTLPDLRFFATTDMHSVGSQLDGGGENPSNAFHNLIASPFNTTTLGLRLDVPIGFRDANSQLRAARLNLERSYLALRSEEDKAERFLGLYYRQVFEFQDQIRATQSELTAARTRLDAVTQQYRVGRILADQVLLAQRDWASALADHYASIVSYNNSLAGLEFAKGSIMAHDSVYLAEGPLPYCAQVRAVEHERERTNALVLKERGTAVPYGPAAGEEASGIEAIPQLPQGIATPLPSLLYQRPPLPAPPAPAAAPGAPAGGETKPVPQDSLPTNSQPTEGGEVSPTSLKVEGMNNSVSSLLHTETAEPQEGITSPNKSGNSAQ